MSIRKKNQPSLNINEPHRKIAQQLKNPPENPITFVYLLGAPMFDTRNQSGRWNLAQALSEAPPKGELCNFSLTRDIVVDETRLLKLENR